MAQIYPLQALLASLSGWLNRKQGEVLEYLVEENRVLKEQLRGRRLRLTDDQRRRLAAKGKRLGRRLLMEVSTRRVHLAGLTTNPTDRFMGTAAEQSRGFLSGCRYLIHDRDAKYSLRFKILMEAAGIEQIKTPYQAPNANAHAERFIRSIKEECLDRTILFGEGHLRRAIVEYLAHYHAERNHQGLGNELIDGVESAGDGPVECSERLGGLLRYYRRAA